MRLQKYGKLLTLEQTRPGMEAASFVQRSGTKIQRTARLSPALRFGK